MSATPIPVVPWRSFGYTMSEQSICHYLRHSSGEGEVQRGRVSVRNSPTTLSVDQCTISMRLPEAFWENETHRLRDSTLHTPPLTCESHWKWIEWNLVCLKWWGSWRLVDWVFSDSWASRRFVREKGNRGWGLDVLAIASDGWFESSSIEWWGNGRMGTWGLEGIGVFEAVYTEVDSIGW